IKSGTIHSRAARPPACADDLMRVRLACNRIGARTFRSAPAREPRHRQIEATPEKMDWTVFPDESGAELGEHCLAGEQNAPETRYRISIVGAIKPVFGEWNGV